MRRRDFIKGIVGSAVAARPYTACAQQPALPVIGFITGGSSDADAGWAAAFRQGLSEIGYVEGQNVTTEYHWLEGRYDVLPALMADLVRRHVAVIATPTTTAALAAKAATNTIPVVFGVGEDPVKLGLVANLAQPGGNATGINYFLQEVVAKRFGILLELQPKPVRIAVLLNPADAAVAEITLREVQEAARTIAVPAMPAPTARSMLPSPPWRVSEPTPSSLPLTITSTVGASNSRCWRRATAFR